MAQYYGKVEGGRGHATRYGSRRSGLQVTAASDSGAVLVRFWHDEDTDLDNVEVSAGSWVRNSRGGYVQERHVLYSGPVERLSLADALPGATVAIGHTRRVPNDNVLPPDAANPAPTDNDALRRRPRRPRPLDYPVRTERYATALSRAEREAIVGSGPTPAQRELYGRSVVEDATAAYRGLTPGEQRELLTRPIATRYGYSMADVSRLDAPPPETPAMRRGCQCPECTVGRADRERWYRANQRPGAAVPVQQLPGVVENGTWFGQPIAWSEDALTRGWGAAADVAASAAEPTPTPPPVFTPYIGHATPPESRSDAARREWDEAADVPHTTESEG